MQPRGSQLSERLQVGEAMRVYPSCYPGPADPRELLAQLGLAGWETTPYGRLSGGQKQRFAIALASVGFGSPYSTNSSPGVDPRARRDTGDLIVGVRAGDVTIVLVTQVVPEAQRLRGRIAVLDGGRVLATGTPARLVESAGQPTRDDVYVALTGKTS